MAGVERDASLEREWRERMARFRASDLSVRAFCQRQGLAEATFHYWRRELKARDVAASRTAGRSSAGEKSQPVFVPLTLIPAVTVSVEVRCPSGHVVCLSSCEVSALTALFAALNPPASEESSC